MSAAFRLISGNLGLFLENRVSVFSETIGLGGRCVIFPRYDLDQLREAKAVPLQFEPSRMASAFSRALDEAHRYSGLTGGRFLFFNYLPFFLLLSGIALLYPQAPYSALIASLILLRSGAVFIAAGGTFTHYYFLAFLGALMCLGLFIGERRASTRLAP